VQCALRRALTALELQSCFSDTPAGSQCRTHICTRTYKSITGSIQSAVNMAGPWLPWCLHPHRCGGSQWLLSQGL